ncbi:BON domain-containing protein [Paraburkholderia sacchari]|uniref:BON domain-containing protein n=1 Tax=Paraburkholderia sacchari TaxID=159450 RepID=UPI001FD3F235|nr:BON domain-containing protein [Paraburkholderia sacchari]
MREIEARREGRPRGRAQRNAWPAAFAVVIAQIVAPAVAAPGEASGAVPGAVTASGASALTVDPGEIRNWYNDPFFALSSAPGACPQPLGPRMTKAEADDDAHYRVERGTTCWLAHKCTKPNSYLYDADIATAIREKFKGAAPLDGTSVWITVQRRFVYAEGCAPAAFDRAALERGLAAIPDVEQVFVRLRADPHARPPYKTLPPAR